MLFQLFKRLHLLSIDMIIRGGIFSYTISILGGREIFLFFSLLIKN